MQVLALRAANAHATVLQGLGRSLSAAADQAQVLQAGQQALERWLHADAWLQVGDTVVSATATAAAGVDRGAIEWVLAHGQPAGRHTDTLSASSWWYLPLRDAQGVIGVAGLRVDGEGRALALEERRLAEAMVEDIAQAVRRTQLVSDLERARVSGETERLRSALLSSVSHDLRSPLASMIGSASSLASYGEAMDEHDRHSLLDTIQKEGERLDRYIQNLLDMTRLGHTGLTLNRDWIGVDELVGSAVARLQRYQPEVQVRTTIAGDVPPMWVHPALLEQAVFNVLENAARFSPPGEAIEVEAKMADGALRIDVRDRGPGIPEDERSRIFDMFYSVERGDRGRQGTGLGLTICQGMVGAHGGSVQALPGRDGRGTVIRITLPQVTPAP